MVEQQRFNLDLLGKWEVDKEGTLQLKGVYKGNATAPSGGGWG